MISLGGIILFKSCSRISQTCFRRCSHGIIGLSGAPSRNPLPQVQPPSTWVLYSLSTESRRIQPPKPPITAFMLFSMEKRPEIKNAQPDIHITQVGKQLGQMWRDLPEADKERYKEMFRVNREKYKQEYDSFMANLSDTEKEQLKQDSATKRKKHLALKKKRKLKSLNKPKRPRSAFLMYYESQMINRGNIPVTMFLKQVAQEWHSLSEIEKEPYLAKASSDKEKYEAEMKAWEERMKAEGHQELVRGYKPPKVRKGKLRKPKKKKAALKKKKTARKAAKKKSTSKKQSVKNTKPGMKKTTSKKKTISKKSSGDESWMREE